MMKIQGSVTHLIGEGLKVNLALGPSASGEKGQRVHSTLSQEPPHLLQLSLGRVTFWKEASVLWSSQRLQVFQNHL